VEALVCAAPWGPSGEGQPGEDGVAGAAPTLAGVE